ADRNRSHWSTSKTPSYTKSVSWQHHPCTNTLKNKNKATISLGRDNFMTAVEKINFLLTRMLQ
ncbi:hypothetical protein, partial [Escherichia coli]|uniref:hypothetical protein n=1 Tax=Escherichia coli TaxID=562 RepID=UPI0008FC0D66